MKMIIHAVLFFLSWQCIESIKVGNISIETIVEELAIPTEIINDFMQKSMTRRPLKKFISNERNNTLPTYYENSNGFTPLIVSSQPHIHRNTVNNITNFNINKLIDKVKINQNNLKSKNRFRHSNHTLNFPEINKNRRSFYTSSMQNDFELLKVKNENSPVASFNSFSGNFQEISNNLNFNTNKSTRNTERNRRITVNRDSTNQLYSGSNENKKKEEEEATITFKPKIIKNYNSQKLPLTKVNYDDTTMKTQTLNTFKKTEEYDLIKSNISNENDYSREVADDSTVYNISSSNPYANLRNTVIAKNSEEQLHKSLSEIEHMNRNYEFTNSRSSFEDDLNYTDELNKSQRLEKINKKRPRNFALARNVPKGYRQPYDDIHEDKKRKPSLTRARSRFRQKSKPLQTISEVEKTNSQESDFDEKINDFINAETFNKQDNTWKQVSPNVEVSASNNFEVNQIEKPKFHIVPLNILSNFDHATALDNSQGFDITNAMSTGLVQDGSIVSTPSSLLSSTTNYIMSSSEKPKIGISTIDSDAIVGQNSFHNPVQTILLPNKIQQSALNQYLQSTVSPTFFAITPRPDYSTANIVPNIRNMLNQAQLSFPMTQQLITAKPLQQSFNNLLITDESNTNIPIYISSNTPQKQNLSPQGTLVSVSNQNEFNKFESKKKKFNQNNNEFEVSESLSVDTNTKSDDINSNINNHKNYNSENNQEKNEKLKALFQSTVIPAFLHTGIGLYNNQNQQLISNPFILSPTTSNPQIINVPNTLQDAMKQFQYSVQNNQYQLATIPNIDSSGASSNTVLANNNIINSLQAAQLPILGTNNVQIVNPNLSTNPYAINQIPATLLTTPIPIITTVNLLGAKQSFSSMSHKPIDDRPYYNPINFIPNYELIRNQSILNNNFLKNDNKKFNFIPLVSIENNYKNSQYSEIDELEKYAKEMFKESLKTIYNSHKWNKDPRALKNISLVDNSEFAKLRNELLRTKNNIRNSNSQADVLEAHQTENKIRASNPAYQYKRPNKPYSELDSKVNHYSQHNRHTLKLNNFLTPPKVNSFVSKNPLRDNHAKKRPNYGPHLNARPRPRQGLTRPKYKNKDEKANMNINYRFPLKSNQENNPHHQSNYQALQSYNFPILTGTPLENDDKASAEYNSLERDVYDINHQRTHNLFGLLMKNRQLPPGRQNSFSKRKRNSLFFNENKQMLPQSYENE